MKTIILLAAFVAGSIGIAHAQLPKKSPDRRAARMAKVLQKRLNLTAGQAEQVNAIYLTQATRMDSLRNNRSADKRLNRLTTHTITLTTREHMLAILNDTQKQQFTEWENTAKERQKARRDTVGARQ